MGDKSPKDKQKRKKQHDKQVDEINRHRQEKQNKSRHEADDPNRKAG